jgi:hypothetical protein
MAVERPVDGPKDLVIAREISRFWLHHVHVIRPKAPVDRMKWIDEIERETAIGGGEVEWVPSLEYYEPNAGFWHCHLYWKEVEPQGVCEEMKPQMDADERR